MNLRGPWWLGVLVGLAILAVGIAGGRVPLIAAGGLVLAISGARALLLRR